jgi:serine phosphatase RsbU (regulator of sigma subunit)
MLNIKTMLRTNDHSVKIVTWCACLVMITAAVVLLYSLDSSLFLGQAIQSPAIDAWDLGIFSVTMLCWVAVTGGMLRRSFKSEALRSRLDKDLNQLRAELSRAGRVQAELLPQKVLELEGFELTAARVTPRGEVGGDFYGWVETGSGRLVLTLGDVMGKGMPAALLMASTRATLQALCRQNSPAEAMNLAARTLEDDLQRSESFVTLFYAQLDAGRGRLSYVDAGHGHAFVRRRNGILEELRESGLPLGILPEERYREGSVKLQPGDALVVYSDGLVDVHPGSAHSAATIAAELHEATSAAEMVNRLVVVGLSKSTGALLDDLTVMVLYCRGEVGAQHSKERVTSRPRPGPSLCEGFQRLSADMQSMRSP